MGEPLTDQGCFAETWRRGDECQLCTPLSILGHHREQAWPGHQIGARLGHILLGKADIHKLLRTLAQDGAAVIMISSELPEILGLSDRVAVMRAGHMVADFDIDEATEEKIVAFASGATII